MAVLIAGSATQALAGGTLVGTPTCSTSVDAGGVLNAVADACVNADMTTLIGSINTQLTDNDTRITTNSTNISTNTTGIATNSTNITTNTTNIATNSTNIATNTTNIAKNSTRIDDLEDESRSGIAAVAAMAAIPAPMNGRKFSVGLGAGHFNGESAIAAGFNARLTDSMTLTGGVGGNGDEVATSLGIGFSW